MTSIDLAPEIVFQTTRSGGKGGQNVNKVETAVIGYFDIDASQILMEEQNPLLVIKWKETLDFLEEATDRCEDAANVLEGVMVKHG